MSEYQFRRCQILITTAHNLANEMLQSILFYNKKIQKLQQLTFKINIFLTL